ncbi:MAG: SDR family oxidoreductase [Patescibacteria group bacterium]
MSKIIVTGGAGFLGSNLCARLLGEGHEVIAVDNLYTGMKRNLELLLQDSKFRFIEHDIIQPLELESGEKIDQIYNLACPASPPAYQKDPLFTLRTSVWGVWNMLELARKHKATFFQASTSEVYGDPLVHPQVEGYWGNVNPIGIRSNYDEGKRVAETMIMDYHRQYGLNVRIIRIFNTYGPNMDPNDGRVVSNFIVQALKNEPLTVYGEGQQTRSFQYVDDLIEGMVRMMNNSQNFIGPVNLGNPGEFTIMELAQKVLEFIPESASQIEYRPLPGDDPKIRKPDITLAKQELNWEPKIDLNVGLEKTIEYFRKVI